MSRRAKPRLKGIVDMMYGFGDVGNPLPESVQLVEELAILYMRDLATKAANVSQRKDTIRTTDVLFVVRKDKKKYWRGREAYSYYRDKEKLTKDTKKNEYSASRYVE